MLELLWKILQAVESEVKQCEKSKKLWLCHSIELEGGRQ